MARNHQRLSQLITTFGPGAMVDLPTRSVIIGGLDHWEMKDGTFASIPEPRLVAALQRRLDKDATAPVSLRTPPAAHEVRGQVPPGVGAFVFPTWFVCERVEETATDGLPIRRRRLVRWGDIDWRSMKFKADRDAPASDVTPIRFVGACHDGHIQDIDWRWVVHQGGDPRCQEAMWLQEKGTSADPSDTEIVCDCGARLSLEQLFAPGRLGQCRGERPWLGANAREACDQDLRFLTRTATNAYFAQVVTVISLPSTEDELTKIIGERFPKLLAAADAKEIATARKFDDALAAALAGHGDEAVFERIKQMGQQLAADTKQPLKLAEFDFFANGRAELGENRPNSQFYGQTLDPSRWKATGSPGALGGIESVVAVHRLRAVSCLYGFTRFDAAPTPHDGSLEELQLAVASAALTLNETWYPAVEQYGEGIFLKFSDLRIQDWLARELVMARAAQLAHSHARWQQTARLAGAAPFPGAAYVMLHGLAHALMTEIALECGYPASALKERVYALEDTDGERKAFRYGILIYTASAGSKGTLGGLVELAPQIGRILDGALERMRLCSNDPVCADHDPGIYADDRALHGAACHGCLFVAETSCEMRNQHLDRQLLVPTMAGDGTEFFE